MGMSKSIKVIVSLAFLVFLALAATKIEAARHIEYPPIRSGDAAHGCDVHHSKKCEKREANHYHRGCESNEHCRSAINPEK